MLKDLYYTDIKRFNFVTQKLKISYTPPKLGEMPIKPTRKGELRRLTREYCEKIKDEKLEAYHKKLIEEQNEFLKQKEEIEKWIKEEEKYLGLTVSEAKK
jgi:small subunit ribosomal protein S15